MEIEIWLRVSKAATAITTGLATSAGLQILPNLQKVIQTISGGRLSRVAQHSKLR